LYFGDRVAVLNVGFFRTVGVREQYVRYAIVLKTPIDEYMNIYIIFIKSFFIVLT
jgi:hypothetical protein